MVGEMLQINQLFGITEIAGGTRRVSWKADVFSERWKIYQAEILRKKAIGTESIPILLCL